MYMFVGIKTRLILATLFSKISTLSITVLDRLSAGLIGLGTIMSTFVDLSRLRRMPEEPKITKSVQILLPDTEAIAQDVTTRGVRDVLMDIVTDLDRLLRIIQNVAILAIILRTNTQSRCSRKAHCVRSRHPGLARLKDSIIRSVLIEVVVATANVPEAHPHCQEMDTIRERLHLGRSTSRCRQRNQ